MVPKMYGVYSRKEIALARADAILMQLEKQTNNPVNGYKGGYNHGTKFLKYSDYSGGNFRVRVHATKHNFKKLSGATSRINTLYKRILQERGLRE